MRREEGALAFSAKPTKASSVNSDNGFIPSNCTDTPALAPYNGHDGGQCSFPPALGVCNEHNDKSVPLLRLSCSCGREVIFMCLKAQCLGCPVPGVEMNLRHIQEHSAARRGGVLGARHLISFVTLQLRTDTARNGVAIFTKACDPLARMGDDAVSLCVCACFCVGSGTVAWAAGRRRRAAGQQVGSGRQVKRGAPGGTR